jgi:hypothetical protein
MFLTPLCPVSHSSIHIIGPQPRHLLHLRLHPVHVAVRLRMLTRPERAHQRYCCVFFAATLPVRQKPWAEALVAVEVLDVVERDVVGQEKL